MTAATLARTVHVKSRDDEVLIEFPPGHKVDLNSYVFTRDEALELIAQLAAAVLASRGRDG